MGAIPGRRRSASELLERPGDFQFQRLDGTPTDDPLGAIAADGKAQLAFVCLQEGIPCGGGKGILIGYPGKPSTPAPSWRWDGNLEAPTLEPSINCLGCWHGWLRAGRWVTA